MVQEIFDVLQSQSRRQRQWELNPRKKRDGDHTGKHLATTSLAFRATHRHLHRGVYGITWISEVKPVRESSIVLQERSSLSLYNSIVHYIWIKVFQGGGGMFAFMANQVSLLVLRASLMWESHVCQSVLSERHFFLSFPHFGITHQLSTFSSWFALENVQFHCFGFAFANLRESQYRVFIYEKL